MSQLILQLQQLQASLRVDDRLGSVVLQERITEILSKAEKITKQKTFIRDERRRVRAEAEELDERKRAMRYVQEVDWIPSDLQGSAEQSARRRLKLVVGGVPFEIGVGIARRDPDSLLSSLTSDIPPIAKNTDDQFVFDRDWWLFRHIVQFLRDGVLPDEEHLLAQLYREANFWKLVSLKRAIESNKLNIRSRHALPTTAHTGDSEWWRTAPSWWRTVDEQRDRKIGQMPKQEPLMSWWTTSPGPSSTSTLHNKTSRSDTETKETQNITLDIPQSTLSSTWNVPSDRISGLR